MAKALFFGLPLHGHTNPSLPLVQELVARGEEIVYYSTRALAPNIEHTGARYRPYRNAFLADMSGLPERMDALAWLLTRTVAELLRDELDAASEERPDYLITDSVAPWGQWVAQLLRVPVVTSISTFAFNRHVAAFGAAHGVRPRSGRIVLSKLRHIAKAVVLRRQLRRRYGVGGTNLMSTIAGHSDLNIVYTSRHFQPRAETFDDRFQFVGPSLTGRIETGGFAWERVQHPVVVYVSMGTLFNADATFYRMCFEAFKGEDFQVILSIGANVSIESLGAPPPNFIVEAQVPQLAVLRRARAFVTHGGMNSVSESLFNDVPVLVIPQMSEQEFVGRRAEQLGAGLYLGKADATPGRLRDSVRRLLVEDRFRQQATVVRESFQSAGGAARAADAVLAFNRQRAPQ
jgi:MGT family glycosyltransferase